jgi:hypothetical protein
MPRVPSGAFSIRILFRVPRLAGSHQQRGPKCAYGAIVRGWRQAGHSQQPEIMLLSLRLLRLARLQGWTHVAAHD